jgi:hypothetical protein
MSCNDKELGGLHRRVPRLSREEGYIAYPFERKTPAFMPGERSESLFRVDRVVVLNA